MSVKFLAGLHEGKIDLLALVYGVQGLVVIELECGDVEGGEYVEVSGGRPEEDDEVNIAMDLLLRDGAVDFYSGADLGK